MVAALAANTAGVLPAVLVEQSEVLTQDHKGRQLVVHLDAKRARGANALIDLGQLSRGVAGAIELACRHRLHRIAARK